MGRMVYQRYANQASDYDGIAARDVGLPGYIIDYDKITRFEHEPTSPWNDRIVNKYARCGY